MKEDDGAASYLERLYAESAGKIEPGEFTLAPERLRASLGSLFEQYPHLIIPHFLRLLHRLGASSLKVSEEEERLILEAAGPWTNRSGPLGSSDAELQPLLLFLQGSPYESWELRGQSEDGGWFLGCSEPGAVPAGPVSLRLTLAGPNFSSEIEELRRNAPWLLFSCSGLPRNPRDEALALGRFGAAPVAAMTESLRARVIDVAGEPRTEILGKARTSYLIEEPTFRRPVLVEVAARQGPSTVRYFCGGALTQPEDLPGLASEGLAVEVIVYSPELSLTSAGTHVLEGEGKSRAFSYASRAAVKVWTSLKKR